MEKEINDIEATKDWLYRYQQKLNDIRILKERITALDTLATSATMDMTSPPVDHTKNCDPLGDIVSRKIDLEEEMKQKCKEALRLMDEIDDEILILPEPEYTILHDKFIEGLCWSEIKKRVRYSKPHMYRKYNKALKELARRLDDKKN